MDQAHITQGTHTQVMGMVITLTTFIMVVIILAHPICQMSATVAGMVIPLLIPSFKWMAMFTVIAITENISLIPMMELFNTFPTFTTQRSMWLEEQRELRGQMERQEHLEHQEQTVQQVWQEALEQMVLEDLLRHHLARVGLAKEAEQVVEGV
jgi:hypothetical protein